MVWHYLAPAKTGTGLGFQLETGRCQLRDEQWPSPINTHSLRRLNQNGAGHKGEPTLDWVRGTRPRPLDLVDSRPRPLQSVALGTRSGPLWPHFTADPGCVRWKDAQIPQSSGRVPRYLYGEGTQRVAAIGTPGSKCRPETGSVPGGVASGSVANPHHTRKCGSAAAPESVAVHPVEIRG